MKRKLNVFIITIIITLILGNVDFEHSIINMNSEQSQLAISFNKSYSIDNEKYEKPTYRAALLDNLEKIISKQGINGVFNPYSPEKALEIIETYTQDIKKYSKYYKVPYQVTMSILFREIICLSYDDTILDNVKQTVIGNATLGFSQNGVKRAKETLKKITGNEYSDNQVKNMLNDEKESIFITVICIYDISKSKNIKLSELKQKDIEYVFSRYNDNLNTKKIYGKETFDYYKLFCEYKNLFDS